MKNEETKIDAFDKWGHSPSPSGSAARLYLNLMTFSFFLVKLAKFNCQFWRRCYQICSVKNVDYIS